MGVGCPMPGFFVFFPGLDLTCHTPVRSFSCGKRSGNTNTCFNRHTDRSRQPRRSQRGKRNECDLKASYAGQRQLRRGVRLCRFEGQNDSTCGQPDSISARKSTAGTLPVPRSPSAIPFEPMQQRPSQSRRAVHDASRDGRRLTIAAPLRRPFSPTGPSDCSTRARSLNWKNFPFFPKFRWKSGEQNAATCA